MLIGFDADQDVSGGVTVVAALKKQVEAAKPKAKPEAKKPVAP